MRKRDGVLSSRRPGRRVYHAAAPRAARLQAEHDGSAAGDPAERGEHLVCRALGKCVSAIQHHYVVVRRHALGCGRVLCCHLPEATPVVAAADARKR